MERLSGFAVGIPFAGRAYAAVKCFFYDGARVLQEAELMPCDVFDGYRTRGRATLAKRYVPGPVGFVRCAEPVPDPGPYVFFGWEARGCRSGGCGGFDFHHGLGDAFSVRLMLRRTRVLLEEQEPRFYYKVGRLAARGAVEGLRLVRQRLWSEVPTETLQLERYVSRDQRFLYLRARWRREE
jgi:hypothetical protein